MQLTRLTARHLRNLQPLDLRLGPGINLVLGANGAGKTSLLEGIHLLAYGRSFRGRVRDGLIRTGEDALEVYCEWDEAGAAPRRSGLRHTGSAWEGRLDGQTVAQLSELCAALVVLTFEPGSHALVSGGSDLRRRFLDWGMFHVEHVPIGRAPALRVQAGQFMVHWRRYNRALKQRNALLKQGTAPAQLDAWDRELADAGEGLHQGREAYLERLETPLRLLSAQLLPQLGQATIVYQPGWRRSQLSLADALLLVRDRDRASGFTSVGPHRADWRIHHEARPGDEALSRGQAKLTALACLLAQGQDYATARGQWPVVLLDDLASELDQRHQQRLLDRLRSSDAQVIITGTEAPVGLSEPQDVTTFHVEQGVLSARPSSA